MASPAAPPVESVGTTWSNVFIVVFLGLQLLATVPGFLHDKYETRGRFSWNMYSVRYGCRIDYTVTDPEGQMHAIDHKVLFNRPDRAAQVFHRDDLPRFHEYLCKEMRRLGRLGRLEGRVNCQLNERPRVELVSWGTDLCTAPNFGVHPR